MYPRRLQSDTSLSIRSAGSAMVGTVACARGAAPSEGGQRTGRGRGGYSGVCRQEGPRRRGSGGPADYPGEIMLTFTDRAREMVRTFMGQGEGELEALRIGVEGSPVAPRFEL